MCSTSRNEPAAIEAGGVSDVEKAVGDRQNRVDGMVVTYGRGEFLVIAIGMQAELGHVANLIQTVTQEPTPRCWGWSRLNALSCVARPTRRECLQPRRGPRHRLDSRAHGMGPLLIAISIGVMTPPTRGRRCLLRRSCFHRSCYRWPAGAPSESTARPSLMFQLFTISMEPDSVVRCTIDEHTVQRVEMVRERN